MAASAVRTAIAVPEATGYAVENRLLLVCFVEHERAVRVISARLATTKERKDYEKGLIP